MRKGLGLGFFMCWVFTCLVSEWVLFHSTRSSSGSCPARPLLMCRIQKCRRGSMGGKWVGFFHEHTCRTRHVFVFFSFDIRSRSKKLTELCFHSYLSTWDRRCLGRWGCSAEPADSGGLYLGGKEGEREWPASGDNRRQLRRPEPGERHLGQKGDEQTTTEKRVW